MFKESPHAVEINISPEKVCYITAKAREFDVKVEPIEPNPPSNSSDDAESEVFEDRASDPIFEELREAIADLNEDEVVDLIAIAWIGRGDFSREEFQNARHLAMERHRPNSAPYLVGIPNLGDCLEEGLADLGHSCDETALSQL